MEVDKIFDEIFDALPTIFNMNGLMSGLRKLSKQCPFCGKEDCQSIRWENKLTDTIIECDKCHTRMKAQITTVNEFKSLINRWNTGVVE